MGNMCGCVRVDQSNVAILEKFGKYNSTLEAGLHLRPRILGYRVAGNVSLQLQQLIVKCEVTTKDKLFVDVVACVQYKIRSVKAESTFYYFSNPRRYIEYYVIQAVRDYIAGLNKNEISDHWNEVDLEAEVRAELLNYGYMIVQALIVSCQPSERVERVMNEVNTATLKANMEKHKQIAKGVADRHIQDKRAENKAECKRISKESIACRHQAAVNELRLRLNELMNRFPGITAKDAMDMLRATEGFETMKEVGATSKASFVLLPDATQCGL